MSDNPVVLGDCTLYLGDCELLLRRLPDNSVDSIVTDPPAGISFMGKEWDKDKGGRNSWILWMTSIAKECLRVLKPGGHAVVWSLPRTSHWTATAWENAGFEVRDRIVYCFGSGFPKSYNVAKGIEGIIVNGSASWNDFHKLNGREGNNGYTSNGYVTGNAAQGNRPKVYESHGTLELEATTEEAKQWDGWGTALKPAVEDWWLLRKPLSEKTVAQNVLKWGTGALNIDACRIESESIPINKLEKWSGFGELVKPDYEQVMNNKGRFPANLIHDGSDEVVNLFPQDSDQKVKSSYKPSAPKFNGKYNNGEIYDGDGRSIPQQIDKPGSAARFFYAAKPDKEERNRGLEGIEEKVKDAEYRQPTGNEMVDRIHGCGKVSKNHHPTVKPLALMEYLIKLITPPNGIVLDPFLGSGTTLVATAELGFRGIGIEKEDDYLKIAIGRIKEAQLQMRMEI